MDIFEIINKKKAGLALTQVEIHWIVENFTNDTIPKYQMSALLMAICLKGMTPAETTWLTTAMAESGDKLDLSSFKEKTIDKHSTGGVGDKTTLIVGPIIAACGLPVAKMSGKGLGHTGGTIDKLEAIPGFRTELTISEFLQIVADHGICVTGQSGNMVPADKKIYALRDVTATVDSIPLIASSIMSKKIAAGAEHILLDVKTGSGAFMKTLESATALATAMVDIGKGCGRKTAALITDMSQPLGYNIGNSLEIMEVIDVLKDYQNAPTDLVEVSIQLATHMLHLVDYGDIPTCRAQVEAVLANGQALEIFAKMVAAQGGNRKYIDDPTHFTPASCTQEVLAPATGYIQAIDAERIGTAALYLGAGRKEADDIIDYTAGIIMPIKIGDHITQGQPIATLYTNAPTTIKNAQEKLLAAISIGENKIPPPKLIHAKI